MQLVSPAFKEGDTIPAIYTCMGEDISPPLQILNPPPGTRSFVLIIEDHDVPKYLRADGMWDHWLLFNIPPSSLTLKKGENSGISGRNTGGTLGYEGPCPPDCEHRYFFKIYALDNLLNLKEGCNKKELLMAMHGHILEEAQLMGRFAK
jgi:Raf kinase inhibitor-like YbhB/YbcL family protein